MKDGVILDTGPLVAFINGRDKYHEWTKGQWAEIRPPLLTCEAVVSEACFLVRDLAGGTRVILELLKRNVLQVSFSLAQSIAEIGWLLNKYGDIPMSVADACLVRMAELYPDSHVLTLDTDFNIYRKNRRDRIPLLSPFDPA